MAINSSQRNSRLEILNHPIGTYDGWVLHAKCPRCRAPRRFLLSHVIYDKGGHHTLMALVNRLKCGLCHRPPKTLFLVQEQQGHRIDLLKNE